MAILGSYPDDSATTASDKYLTYDTSGATKLTSATTLKDYVLPDNGLGGIKLSTYKVIRQNDTTNVTENTARILTGWGVITPGAVNAASETITFNSAFTSAPIVTLTYGGDAASASTYGSGGITIKDSAIAIAHTITSTGFTARFVVRDATNWAAGNTVFYQWIAIGA